MRTERRHELQTNTLAKDLEIGYEKFRPYANQVLVIGGVVLLLLAAFSYWRSSQIRQERAAWEALETALLKGDRDLGDVRKVSEDQNYAGLVAQEWAAVDWADRQLMLAANEYLALRDGADERLDAIAGIYRQFSSSASSEEVRNRARLGLARVHELRNEVDEAIAAYQRVGGALEEIAQDRLESLKRPEGAEAVNWLASAKFQLPKSATGPGIPGTRPEFSPGEPSPDGAEVEFDPNRSLEDILGGLGNDEDDRYGETTPATSEADDASAPAEEPAPESSDAESKQ